MKKIIFNTFLGIILIYVWSRFVDIHQIITTIKEVNVVYLFPAFLFMFLSPAVRALRLKIFLSEIKKISLKDLVFLNGVAMMLNFFIPIRAGEIAKGVYLNTNHNLDIKKGIIWIFLDRFVDFLVVLGMTVLLLLNVKTNISSNFIFAITMVLLFALFATFFAVYRVSFTKKIFSFLRYLFIKNSIKLYFDRVTNFIIESLSILHRHPKDLILMVVLSIISYAFDGAVWYFVFISLGFPQDFFNMYLGQTLSALTYLIPAAPGYIGSAEASGLLVLSGVFGINSNLSSAMIVLFHISSAIFILVYGLISMFFLKIDLGIILNKALKRG